MIMAFAETHVAFVSGYFVRRFGGAKPPSEQRLPGLGHDLFLVVGRGPGDFFLRTQEHRHTLVQAFGLDVENTLVTVSGSTRSEEHTSELQSLMRNSYAVCCLKQNNKLSLRHQRTTQLDYTRLQ